MLKKTILDEGVFFTKQSHSLSPSPLRDLTLAVFRVVGQFCAHVPATTCLCMVKSGLSVYFSAQRQEKMWVP